MLKLKDSKIFSDWSSLLPDCQGEGPGLLQSIQDLLASGQVPGISWKEESASTGLMKGLLGKRRNVLVVRSEQFPEWLVCIGAQDYGRFLNVVWYLTAAPKFLNKLRGGGLIGLATGGGAVLVDELDVFDKQDFDAFADITRMAVISATEEFAKRRQLDLSRLARQARGLPAAS